MAEMLFSCSDSARSCFMISAFSPFFAFLGAPANSFVNIATSAAAITTPMTMITMLLIYAAFSDVGNNKPSHASQHTLRPLVSEPPLDSTRPHFQTFSTIRVVIAPVRMHMKPTIISGL